MATKSPSFHVPTPKSNMRITCLIVLALFAPDVFADDRIATKDASKIPADPAAEMVAGIDRFVLRKWDETREQRADHWCTQKQFTENRQQLTQLLGLETNRHPAEEGFLVEPKPIATNEAFVAHAVRWPVLSHPAPQTSDSPALWGEGIHLTPSQPNQTLVIILPDASELPEHWLPLGMADNSGKSDWRERFATSLAHD